MLYRPARSPICLSRRSESTRIARLKPHRWIQELIALAKDMKKAGEGGEQLGLNEDETAFYDALEVNDSAW